MASSTYDEPGAECISETDKAILITRDGDPTHKAWIPKSVIHDDSEVFGKGGEGTLIVQLWWAEKQGWI